MLINGQIIFTGSGVYAADTKGRVSIPSEYRHECEGSFVLTKGMKSCLRVYSVAAYESLVKQLMEMSDNFNGAIMLDDNFRTIVENLTAEVANVKADDHGRILIPAPMRSHIGLGKQVRVHAMGAVFEIWDEDTFQAERAAAMENGKLRPGFAEAAKSFASVYEKWGGKGNA